MFRRGRYWYAYHPVTKRKTPTHCTDRQAAEKTVARWQREAADPTHRDTPAKTLADAYQLVTAEKLRRGKSAGTREMYDQKLRQWARVAEHIGPRLGEFTPLAVVFTADFVDAFERYRREEGIKSNTLHKEFVAIRQAGKLSARRGWLAGIDWSSSLPVGFSPEYEPRTAHLPMPLWQRLLDALPPNRRAVVAWHLGTGANAGEATLARAEHLRPDAVQIRGEKTKFRDRVVPILGPMRPFVEVGAAWLREHGKFDTWNNVNRGLRAACRRASVPELTTNDLRRSFASALVQAGVPFDLAAKLMGHGSTKMLTMVYGQLDASHLAALIDPIVSRWDANGTSPRPTAPPEAAQTTPGAGKIT